MPRSNDNWEKLVAAVLKREEDRALAFCESFDTSHSISDGYESSSSRISFSQSSSFRYHDSLSSSSRSTFGESSSIRNHDSPILSSFWLSARGLQIAWKDDSSYWKWTSLLESRFSEVAELISVCWFDIIGIMEHKILSPNTIYTSYLVFKLTKEHQGLGCSTTASIKFVEKGLPETEVDTSIVYIVPRGNVTDGRVPQTRSDGWMEIEIGTFLTCEKDKRIDIYMRLSEVKELWWKSGLIIEGIEVRPRGRS